MGTTDTFHLDWPELGAAADGPGALEEIAKDTNTALRGARPRKVLLHEATLPYWPTDRAPGTTVPVFAEEYVISSSGAYWVEVEVSLPLYQPVDTSPIAGFAQLKVANVMVRNLRYHSQGMVPIVLPLKFSGATDFGFNPGQRVGVNFNLTIDGPSAPVRWTDGSIAVWAVAPIAAP